MSLIYIIPELLLIEKEMYIVMREKYAKWEENEK
jgi:hypothetical protein